MKLVVLELATGNFNVEDWTVQTNFDLKSIQRTIKFDKNFALVDFNEYEFYLRGNDPLVGPLYQIAEGLNDFLILDLVSRKPFWTRRQWLFDQIKGRDKDF